MVVDLLAREFFAQHMLSAQNYGLAAVLAEREGHGRQGFQHGRRVRRVDALFQHVPGNGPVHGPGVDERIAEAVRDELGDGGFSGGGGAVNGDGWMHECLLSWKWGLKPFEL